MYFLPKMTVDKVNRIRIAKILAGGLSLDRGRADDTLLAVTMLKHSGPFVAIESYIDTAFFNSINCWCILGTKRGHCISSKLSRSVHGRTSKVFPCRS